MQDIISVATYDGKDSAENSVRIDIVKVAPPIRNIDGLFQELFGFIEMLKNQCTEACPNDIKLGVPQEPPSPSAARNHVKTLRVERRRKPSILHLP